MLEYRPIKSGQFLRSSGHRVDMRDDSAQIVFDSFSAGGYREQIWHGQGRQLSDVVHSAVPLLAEASSTPHGALKDSFAEAVEARGLAEIGVSVSSQFPEGVPVGPGVYKLALLAFRLSAAGFLF